MRSKLSVSLKMSNRAWGAFFFIITFAMVVVAMMFAHCNAANAARGGVCYEKAVANSKHIFFSIEEGRNVLKDIAKLNKTEQALDLEKKLHTIEKRNSEILSRARMECEKAVVAGKKAINEAAKLVSSLKKELQKSWEERLALKAEVAKYKSQRFTWLLVGIGVGSIVAGGVAFAITGISANEAQLRAGLIGAGAGGVAVGATMIGIAIFR